MGIIRLTSAVIAPENRILTRTPPIPSWQSIGVATEVPGRWVGLWGYNTVIAALAQAHAVAKQRRMRLYTATITVEVERTRVGSIKPEHLSKIDHLPIDQVDTVLAQKIYDLIEKRHDPDESGGFLEYLAEHPESLNLLFRHPEFRHIKVITWQAAPSVGLGAIRKAEDVSEVFVRGLPPPYRLAGWSRIFKTDLPK